MSEVWLNGYWVWITALVAAGLGACVWVLITSVLSRYTDTHLVYRVAVLAVAGGMAIKTGTLILSPHDQDRVWTLLVSLYSSVSLVAIGVAVYVYLSRRVSTATAVRSWLTESRSFAVTAQRK